MERRRMCMSVRIVVTYKHMQEMEFMKRLLSLHDMRGQCYRPAAPGCFF